MIRPALTVASLALAGLALPASAVPPPEWTPLTDCVAVVVAADATASDGCDTLGGRPALSGATPVRELTLTVLTGRARATLTCGGENLPSVTLVLDGAGTGSTYLEADGYCWVTVTSTYPRTTAVATNTGGYLFK